MHVMRILLIFSLVSVLLISVAGAKLVDNPEAVSYMHVKLVKGGSVHIEPEGPLARATGLTIYLSMPQNTDRQSSSLTGVEGPDSHGPYQDQWGNEMIMLQWDNPPLDTEISYSLSFDVEVRDGRNDAPGRQSLETGLNRATLEMTEKAYNLASGLDDIAKAFRITEWVHDWIDYDLAYQDSPKSAQWVFGNRKGICSAYSNLLISMLRAVGFRAYYVIGYAYTEETPGSYWGSHGWVEMEYGGKSISLDPTWLESPVDGTHIKFANAPDSNYTERAEVLGSHVGLLWEREEPGIELIDIEESERIMVDAGFVPGEVGSESYSMLMTRVTSGSGCECMLSQMQIQSCSMGSGYFLEVPVTNQTVSFCGSDTLYWFLKTPELKGNTEYTCPVSVYIAGSVEKPELRAGMVPGDIRIRMATQNVLTPGQALTAETVLENHGSTTREIKAYILFGDSVQEKDVVVAPGYQAKLTWTMQAPESPGTTKLRFFSSSGNLIEEDLTVISRRRAEIADVSMPDNLTLGDTLFLNITIRGLDEASGEVQVKINGKESVMEFSLDKGESRSFLFPYEPVSSGSKDVSVILLSEGRYEDGMIGSIEVLGGTGFLDQIMGWISGFLEWLGALIGL